MAFPLASEAKFVVLGKSLQGGILYNPFTIRFQATKITRNHFRTTLSFIFLSIQLDSTSDTTFLLSKGYQYIA